jgi:hypothetical protein
MDILQFFIFENIDLQIVIFEDFLVTDDSKDDKVDLVRVRFIYTSQAFATVCCSDLISAISRS